MADAQTNNVLLNYSAAVPALGRPGTAQADFEYLLYVRVAECLRNLNFLCRNEVKAAKAIWNFGVIRIYSIDVFAMVDCTLQLLLCSIVI